jgi:hypothetical protein
VLLLMAPALRAEEAGRPDVVRQMLQRSKLLEDTYFQVPVRLWQQYEKSLLAGEQVEPVPVAMIASQGRYSLEISADRQVRLHARVVLDVLDPQRCGAVSVLSAALAWEEVKLDDQAAELPTIKGYLQFRPARAGQVVIEATAPLPAISGQRGGLNLPILATTQTFVDFDSPLPWQVAAARRRPWWARARRARTGESPCRRTSGWPSRLARRRRRWSERRSTSFPARWRGIFSCIRPVEINAELTCIPISSGYPCRRE